MVVEMEGAKMRADESAQWERDTWDQAVKDGPGEAATRGPGARVVPAHLSTFGLGVGLASVSTPPCILTLILCYFCEGAGTRLWSRKPKNQMNALCDSRTLLMTSPH